MSGLYLALHWCVVQVTAIGLLAWLLCAIYRRMAPASSSPVPATALAAVLVLTLSAFFPWPAAWSYGPTWTAAAVSAPPSLTVGSQATPKAAPTRPDVALAPPALGEGSAPAAANAETTFESESPWDEHRPATVSPSVTSHAPAVNESAGAPVPSDISGTGNIAAVILVLLAIGAALGLAQLIGGLIAAQSYRRASTAVNDKRVLELVDVLCAELGCRAKIELRETALLATAATIGWRRPLVLLPAEWRGWSDEELRAVLAHEIAHVTRHDFLAVVLAQASLALHFYHPLVHWLVYRLRLEQELAADAQAARVAGGAKNYLQTLAEMALRQTERPLGWPARTFLPTQGTFMRRIEMLRDAKSGGEKTPWRWPKWLAVVVLIAGAIAIAGLRGGSSSNELQAQAQAQDPKPKPATKAEQPAANNDRISLAYVPNDVIAVAALRPGRLVSNPETAEALKKLDKSMLHLEEAGVSLDKIEQITVPLVVSDGRKLELVIVEASGEVDFAQIARLLMGHGKEVPELPAAGAGDDSFIAYSKLGERAAVIGRAHDILAYRASKRGEVELADSAAWKKVSNRTFVAAIDMRRARIVEGLMPQRGDAPEVAMFAPILDETEVLAVGVAVEKQLHVRGAADCLGKDGADKVKETAASGGTMLRNLIRAQRSAAVKHEAQNLGVAATIEPEFIRKLLDAADKALSNVAVEQEGLLVTAEATVELKGGPGAALSALVPSVDAARKAAGRAQAMNNIKQIMLAMHNYADVNGRLPPAVIYGKDGKGKVPHSWRVALLPYLDQDALYRAYNFDEPWDSETNKKVLAQMPAVFRSPGVDPKSTTSAYYVLVGKMDDKKKGDEGGGAAAPPGGAGAGAVPLEGGPAGVPPGVPAEAGAAGVPALTGLPTLFSRKQGLKFMEIHDGTSNTIAVVEAKREIPWTKPEDIPYDPQGKMPELGGFFAGGFHVGIADGSVRFLSANTDTESLKTLLSPAAGDMLPPDKQPAPIGAPPRRPAPAIEKPRPLDPQRP